MARKSTVLAAWSGWAFFASALLLVIGGLQVVTGLAALLRDNFYTVAQSGLVAFTYTTWGWISLVLGVLVVLAVVGMLVGMVWARLVAVFLTALVMVATLGFSTAYPLWSVITLILSGFVIYALTARGDEL